MIDDEYAALGRRRNIDVVGPEPRRRYHDELFSRFKDVSGDTLRRAHPQRSRAIQDLLDLIDVAAIDDDHVRSTFGQHFVAGWIVHRPPKHHFSLRHSGDAPSTSLDPQ